MNPKIESLNPKVESLNPGIESLNPKIESLNPKIESLNPKNESLNPKIESLNPKIESLSPKTESLNPENESCIHYERYPQYLKQILNRRSGYYSLRGMDIIDLPKVMTTKYGLHSFRYEAVKRWNSLPDSCRVQDTLRKFIKSISDINFEN